MSSAYWQKQDENKPLFPDILWNKPEQKSLSGSLAIIGGNKFGFSGVNNAYRSAVNVGVGDVKMLLPDCLKKAIPTNDPDIIFSKSNQSGGFSKDAKYEISSLIHQTDGTIFIGDNGKNSETASIFENLIEKSHISKPIIITRDTVDLIMPSIEPILDKENIIFIISFAQMQKIFRTVHYPKMLTFSMQLAQVVETIHKFSITFECTLVVVFNENIIISRNGKVITQNWNQPMRIWQGDIASIVAGFNIWNPKKPLEATISSFTKF